MLSLTQLHNVIEQYTVVEAMLGEVNFGIELEAVRNGILPVECSWVEVFLALMNTKD